MTEKNTTIRVLLDAYQQFEEYCNVMRGGSDYANKDSLEDFMWFLHFIYNKESNV